MHGLIRVTLISTFLFYNENCEKIIDLKHEKAISEFDCLISCRKNSFFPKFLHFKVSNKQLRASKAFISCQKRLLNQEVNNQQKAVKTLQEKVIEVENSLNCKISYID